MKKNMSLEQMRINNGLTQAELAKQLDVKQQLVSKWENKKGVPHLKIVKKLAKILSVEVIDIINFFE